MLCVWPLSETGFSVDQFKAHDPILQAALNFNRLLHGGIRYLKCGFVSGKNLTRVANTASYQYVVTPTKTAEKVPVASALLRRRGKEPQTSEKEAEPRALTTYLCQQLKHNQH